MRPREARPTLDSTVVSSEPVGIRAGEVELREVGPPDAVASALLLPGGLCSAVLYEDVLVQAARTRPPVRLVAVTPPGFAGRAAPPDVSIESFARLSSERAARLGYRVVVGHSLGANIAIEVALSQGFDGPLVLLSPSFSRMDEFRALGVVDRIGRNPGIGRPIWAAILRAVSGSPRRSGEGWSPATASRSKGSRAQPTC
jgi:pimeloyl-ACP methyl ester carboxylesterase